MNETLFILSSLAFMFIVLVGVLKLTDWAVHRGWDLMGSSWGEFFFTLMVALTALVLVSSFIFSLGAILL